MIVMSLSAGEQLPPQAFSNRQALPAAALVSGGVVAPTSAAPLAGAAATAAAATLQTHAPAEEEQSQQRSLVLNCSPSSLLQKRKALYDAMVQLEQQQQGLVLVERAMPYPDVIMTPAIGLCIWSQHNLQVGVFHACYCSHRKLAPFMSSRS